MTPDGRYPGPAPVSDAGSPTLAVVQAPAAVEPAHWYRLSPDEACRSLGVDPAVGLDAAEVAERRERYGPNKLAEEA